MSTTYFNCLSRQSGQDVSIIRLPGVHCLIIAPSAPPRFIYDKVCILLKAQGAIRHWFCWTWNLDMHPGLGGCNSTCRRINIQLDYIKVNRVITVVRDPSVFVYDRST